MSTIDAVLAMARQHIETSEARLLLCHRLGRTPAWLAAHGDDPFDAAQRESFQTLIARRAAGEPIAYLCGEKEFHGRDFLASPAVLIPRPETELLVDLALVKAKGIKRPRLLDLGTGSGCVAITLALECRQARVSAADASTAALSVARGNSHRLGAVVKFTESDWFAAFHAECFDVIVANPPYVAADDSHLKQGDLRFEPLGALISGPDGLEAIRQIIAAAPEHLLSGGWLLFEHGYDQAEAVARLLATADFTEIEQHRDLAGIVRVSGGRKA